MIEKSIDVSKEKYITQIYYIDIWDNSKNEILRDKYILNSDNKLEQTIKGTDTYYEILNRFDNVLSDYTLKDKDGNLINVGEKRIFAPNFIYVKNGKAETLVSGISSKQKDSYEVLTTEILDEETKIFSDFFEENCGC